MKKIILIAFVILFAIVLGLYFFIPKNIPTAFTLQVPFSAQAPTDKWSRNEDCEETSIVMAYTFLNGNTDATLPPTATQEAINSLKRWEQANLGYNADTGAIATSKMAEGAFGLKIKQIKNFTETNLKTALINGHPILLPINAKLLGSPQYLENGPTYHMIVIKGFRNDIFIVNDPGTDRGESQEYSFAVLQKASADWDNVSKKIISTNKIALVVYK